jgi:CheY-like chemotaxis protein
MKTSQKILVVDDDAVVGQSFDRVLSEKGYSVSTALSGREALNKLDRKDYDVVFTDIKMPGMDGLEVAKRIRDKCPWTPVVIVTGYGTAANEAKAEVLGVSGFVRKPLTPEIIEGITRKALREKPATAPPQEERETAVEPRPEVAKKENALKNIALFMRTVALLIAAPFVGLAYAITFPIFGLGLLAWMGARALARYKALKKVAVFLKNVTLFIAAPFVGLVYVMLFPFIGIGMLAWIGIRPLGKRLHRSGRTALRSRTI